MDEEIDAYRADEDRIVRVVFAHKRILSLRLVDRCWINIASESTVKSSQLPFPIMIVFSTYGKGYYLFSVFD